MLIYLLGANCRRGGFVCEGYQQKVNWPAPKLTSPAVYTKPEPTISGSGSPTAMQVQAPNDHAMQTQMVIHHQTQPPTKFVGQTPGATIRVVERQAVRINPQNKKSIY